ncbi:MAG: P1 family peptidase [Clostridia bacterium]|nr:P1 family peptidase [Clostridia bacterium]
MSGKRIADYGVHVGSMERGRLNKITDVPGVLVGHATIRDERHHTGVTVILPCADNMFKSKLTAASYVLNGFGKTQGLVQVDELGTLETPIALTNTLNVGKVHDALVTYMAQRCAQDRVEMRSINPVVGECNDASLSDIADRPVTQAHVMQAIESACEDFEEGCVGAGAGTVCHDLKGGVGSASRVMTIEGRTYTLGVLVQSNHGCLQELHVLERPLGREIMKKRSEAPEEQPQDLGSIMMVVATDLPVSDRQLRRILKRCSVGLARNGSYFGHGSGDVMIGFTTANRMPHGGMHRVLTHQVVTEHTLEMAFRAAAEATQEAVLNSLCAAEAVTSPINGKTYESITKYL